MQIEDAPLTALHEDPANLRKHDDRNLAAIAASLAKFGQQKPIVANKDGVVLAGNGTLRAAKSLGWESVAVVRTTLEGAEAIAYAIADNRTAELAAWDDDNLAATLAHIETDHPALLEATGFSAEELRELESALPPTEGLTDPDAIPEVVESITKPGDIWLLGSHRLMCGDSTKTDDVARLMDGQKAQLMQTDPPYGVNYANDERPNPGVAKPRVAKPRVANDDLLEGKRLQEFLEAMIRAALPSLDSHAAFYLWHPMLTQSAFFAAAAAAADILIHRQIIWAKPVLLLGRGDYHWKHELCFYGWVRGNRPPFYGPRNQTTVWEIASVSQAERKDMNHATPKPVALWLAPIENHTKPGQIMYEPFSGSGSQIIAAEQTNRRCYAMEIAPQYCDVAVKRWEQFTGKKASRQ